MPYKLSREEVAGIRDLISQNVRQVEIARRYNVSQATVSLIKSERRWKKTDHRHHFDDAEIRAIRDLHKMGVSQREIGKRYNVSQATISNILLNKTYSWVK